jgi:hypothetical protein
MKEDTRLFAFEAFGFWLFASGFCFWLLSEKGLLDVGSFLIKAGFD